MKQARQSSRLRIQPGEICAFVQIAVMTGNGKILRRVFSFVLARREMLDVKCQRLLIPDPAAARNTHSDPPRVV